MNYTHKVTRIGGPTDGGLCSEHKSEAGAVKAVRRYVTQSNGKLTVANFKIEKCDVAHYSGRIQGYRG